MNHPLMPIEPRITPLVTVVLMAYKQEKFIRDSILGALNQTYSPLEIIISDDASPDDTWRVMQDVVDGYLGPHVVHLRRGEVNLGINRHFNALMKMVKGQFIVIMAGDDISFPNRVETSIRELLANDCYGMYSNGIRIDEDGKELGLYIPESHQSKKISWQSILKSAGNGGAGFSMCWRREVVEEFGEIPLDPLGEDSYIPFRSALLGNFFYFQMPLVYYREHGSNASFWFVLQKCKDVHARKETAWKWANHHLKRYEKWQLDAQLALQQGFISKDDYVNFCTSIGNMIWLYHQRIENLKKPMVSLLLTLVYKRKAYESLGIDKVGRREFQAYLSVLHPKLLRALISFTSTARNIFPRKIGE